MGIGMVMDIPRMGISMGIRGVMVMDIHDTVGMRGIAGTRIKDIVAVRIDIRARTRASAGPLTSGNRFREWHGVPAEQDPIQTLSGKVRPTWAGRDRIQTFSGQVRATLIGRDQVQTPSGKDGAPLIDRDRAREDPGRQSLEPGEEAVAGTIATK